MKSSYLLYLGTLCIGLAGAVACGSSESSEQSSEAATPRPVCPTIRRPVCALPLASPDLPITYENSCYATLDDATIVASGECVGLGETCQPLETDAGIGSTEYSNCSGNGTEHVTCVIAQDGDASSGATGTCEVCDGGSCSP